MSSTLDLLIALSRQAGRRVALDSLASHFGSQDAVLFVRDPAGVPTLAPGVRDMAAAVDRSHWQAFLKASKEPGRHVGAVESLRPAEAPGDLPAVAYADSAAVLVFVGAEPPAEDAELLLKTLPLLGALLEAESRQADPADITGAAVPSPTPTEGAATGDADKHEFLAMLAHELRNPLSPIVTGIALLQRQEAASAATQRLLALMARQAKLLSRLVEDLVDMARVNQGRITLRLQPLLLTEVVAQAVDSQRHALEAKQLQLTLSQTDEPLRVQADPERMMQVVANLLDNAAKYTEPGGQVNVVLRRDRGEALIEVTDTGIGIDASMMPRIFQLFSQAPPTIDRGQGGVGVGLTLAHKLMQLHRGRIEVHSAGRGHGSRFRVRLPLLDVTSGAAPPPAEAPFRVLVVDDNADAADMVAETLREEGMEADVAYDGEAALQALQPGLHDLLLLDLGLPRIDGFEVGRRARQRLGDSVRIVALTGYGADADRVRTREAGFDAHCVKPISEGDLRDLIKRQREALRTGR